MWGRCFSTVALLAIVLAIGLNRRLHPDLANLPHPNQLRGPRQADGAIDLKPVAIPRVNLDAVVGGVRPSSPVQQQHSAAIAPTNVDDHPSIETVPDRVAPPPSVEQRASNEAPLSRVAELMVCHLDSRGPFGAADVLQECISRAPAYSSIEIPPGAYVFHRQVVVATPVTIRTAGSAGTSLSCASTPAACATFVAAADFTDPWGIILVTSTNNVSLEHIVIDGDRQARLASRSARACLDGRNNFGFNASVLYCGHCGLADVLSRNALCGTGMAWVGANATIQNSTFQANGDGVRSSLWADGLTVIYAPQSEISDNQFIDNTDVALIVGYGVASRIERNAVRQRTQASFAGLMLHNFSSNDLSTGGDFRGAVVAHNTIDCGAQLCVFGIQVGPRPWNAKLITVGGDLHDNEVRGAKVGINVDGAGIFRAPVAIHGNVVSAVPEGEYFSDCSRPIATGAINISPTSVVDRGDEKTPTGAHLSDLCQLSSTLTAEDQ
jgi:hypothetical protein